MFRRMLDSAVILALLTAFLFCVGTAKTRGFYSHFRLDSDVMDLGFHNVLYAGMIWSIVPVVKALTLLVATSFFYSHMVLPNVIDKLRGSFGFRRTYVKWKKRIYGKRKETSLERSAKKNTIRFFLVTLGLVLFIGFLAGVETEGKRQAEEVLAGGHESDLRKIVVNGDSRVLTFLSCGIRNCAAYDSKSGMIIYFDQAKGFSYFKEIKKGGA